MDKTALLDACVAYFRQYPIYEKVLTGLRRKYISLARTGGTVTVEQVSRAEQEQLQGFLGELKYQESGTVKISAALFKKALKGSRFSAVTYEELLEAYFQEPLQTNAHKKKSFQDSWNMFFTEIIAQASAREFREWLTESLKEKQGTYIMLRKKYLEDPKTLKTALLFVNRAVAELPVRRCQWKHLPVFAAEITGNPHYFDEGEFPGRLLAAYLQYLMPGEDTLFPMETKWNRLYQAGIVKDELWNHVLTYGLQGEDENGRQHQGMSGYGQEGEPVHLSLLTLSHLKRISAPEGRVYVVENPSVFAELVERFHGRIAVLCTSGQLQLAALVLLNLLVASGIQLLYAGDFDPEGLRIADKLKQKYGKAFTFWLYERRYYERAVSRVELTETRIAQLDGVSSPQLSEISECLRQTRRAGYQERLLEEYVKSVEELQKLE